jgi:hypothetical protein
MQNSLAGCTASVLGIGEGGSVLVKKLIKELAVVEGFLIVVQNERRINWRARSCE